MNKAGNMMARIESHRNKPNFRWKLAIACKDALWLVFCCIPGNIKKQRDIYRSRRLSFKNIDWPAIKNPRKFRRISFCITCMGRLEHLRKVLQKNIKDNASYPDLQFVLLDYNSRDGLERWVRENCAAELKSGRLACYRTDKPTHFHMARAKNIAHNLADGEIVCGLDADNLTARDFAFYINHCIEQNPESIGIYDRRFPDCGGRIFLSADNFKKLGGYDENMAGWGYEDEDFRQRALRLGLSPAVIPVCFMVSLGHDNGLREKNMPLGLAISAKQNSQLTGAHAAAGISRISNPAFDLGEFVRIR